MTHGPVPLPEELRNDRRVGGPPLTERTLYVPRMSYAASRCFAAAFRSFGVDAHPFPPSDEKTLEYGGRYTSGEECLPERLTLGDALKVVLAPGARPERIAFFMPSAPGPCRFGQYAPFLRKTLDEIGATETMVLSPESGSGYDQLGSGLGVQRACWRALVAADLQRKALLRVRPYEVETGAADAAYETGITETCRALERPGVAPRQMLRDLRAVMDASAARFRAIPMRFEERVLIGVIGEIFCRLNTFSNEDLVRELERQGGEAWIADIGEWVYYTNLEQRRKWIPYDGGRWSLRMLSAWMKDAVQRRDEHHLAEPFHDLFRGREEPANISVVTAFAEPYLPAEGVYGEMVVNSGKAIYLWSRGCDGIVDISPFTCMNGIVSEAIYPKISRDHDGIPIRIFYFDGTQSHLDRDLGIFLELARGYRGRKTQPRS
jgi:predicted nucleotide-binding protein (sugar kinase/HSP70/actin superfamily)